MTLSTIRARILLGRPGGVYGRVDDDMLMDVVARIVAAYEKAAAPSPWAFHLIMLRHDGKWAEQLIQIELDRMDVGADAATYCAATVIDVAVRMRECNAVYVEPVNSGSEETSCSQREASASVTGGSCPQVDAAKQQRDTTGVTAGETALNPPKPAPPKPPPAAKKPAVDKSGQLGLGI